MIKNQKKTSKQSPQYESDPERTRNENEEADEVIRRRDSEIEGLQGRLEEMMQRMGELEDTTKWWRTGMKTRKRMIWIFANELRRKGEENFKLMSSFKRRFRKIEQKNMTGLPSTQPQVETFRQEKRMGKIRIRALSEASSLILEIIAIASNNISISKLTSAISDPFWQNRDIVQHVWNLTTYSPVFTGDLQTYHLKSSDHRQSTNSHFKLSLLTNTLRTLKNCLLSLNAHYYTLIPW